MDGNNSSNPTPFSSQLLFGLYEGTPLRGIRPFLIVREGGGGAVPMFCWGLAGIRKGFAGFCSSEINRRNDYLLRDEMMRINFLQCLLAMKKNKNISEN